MSRWQLSVPTRDDPSQTYTLTCFATYMTCSCRAFRFQKKPNGQRTCKHLNQWRAQVAQLSNPFGDGIVAVPITPSPLPAAAAAAVPPKKTSRRRGAIAYGTCAVFAELQRPEQWQRIVDEHWWYSEKKDGIRVKWCAQTKCLRSSRSQSNHCWVLPSEWQRVLRTLPSDWDLDMEICGTQAHTPEEAQTLGLWDPSKKKIISTLRQALTLQGDVTGTHPWWQHAHLYIFDCIPRDVIQDTNHPLARRYDILQQHVSPPGGVRWISVVPQYPVTDGEDLVAFYQEIIHSGGEGVMIRDPQATYYVSSDRRGIKWKQWVTREVSGDVRHGRVYFTSIGEAKQKWSLPVREPPYRIEMENMDAQGEPRSIRWAEKRWTPLHRVFFHHAPPANPPK